MPTKIIIINGIYYEKLDILGTGEQGSVYKARNLTTREFVALTNLPIKPESM